ncbi:MAG TPA: DUF2939 domain-containing protein [Gemmatimonadales bacterium]|nr:DUF2939 domain-containing protein [Gemmatimonadales bacterium]
MRFLRWLLLGLVVLTGIWYVWTPRRAYDRMMRGLVTADEAAIAATVDFPVLRDHLRADLQTAIDGRITAEPSLRATLASTMLEPMLQLLLTPSGLAEAVNTLALTGPEADSLAASVEPRFRYRGPSTVEVELGGTIEDPAGTLTFSRRGIGWQLTRMQGGLLGDR